MQARMWANEYRTTVVCIDRYDRRVPEGRFYNPYCPEAAGRRVSAAYWSFFCCWTALLGKSSLNLETKPVDMAECPQALCFFMP